MLHQQATGNFPTLHPGALRGRCLEDADVFLLGQDVHRAVFVTGCDDHFGENLGDVGGHLHGDFAVGGDNTTESGHGVAGVCALVGCGNGLVGHGNAAGVGVFNDGHAGTLVVPGGTPRGIRIGVVVVAHFLAVQLGGLSKPGRCGAVTIQRRSLMRVFAVAKRCGQLVGGTNPGWEFSGARLSVIAQPGGHGDVVGGGVAEGVDSQCGSFGAGEAASGEGVDNLAVARGGHDHGDGGVVFGGGAHHGGTANVDLFHAGVEVSTGGDGLGEGI